MKNIRDAGFAEVEITADKRHLDPRIYPRQKLPEIRNLLKNLPLRPNSVHAPIDGADLSTSNLEERKRAVDLLIDTLEYCRAIDCPIAVVHPNHSNSLPLGAEAMKRNSMETLNEIVAKAEDLGVKVALENMIEKEERRFGSRVADLIEIIEGVGSSHLGICLDTGHTNLIPKPDVSLEEEIIRAGEKLWTLHVHDNDGRMDYHWPPGEGKIDWSKVVRGLRRANYRGVFMMEVQERGDPEKLARTSLQKAIEILGAQ
ncbi:MAG: sugar phosphate isomerase/epimerase family protein [Candidatus Bathyarchaeia archaeon]